ncbi:MAG: sulfotransferase domain-containing protein [Caldilineaceae bacterium]
MPGEFPVRTHIYQNHVFDGTHWDHYLPRRDDVIVSTSYRSGTTWTQNIVLQLIFLGQPKPALADISPWLGHRTSPLAPKLEKLAAQQNQRLLKTHLPLDAFPYYAQVRYIVVGRDARDVFMSFWNHYSNYTDATYERLNDPRGRVGDPMPRCPDDIHELWDWWINRGWFAWESEGYPHSGNMYHTQSWWNFRYLDNILFVHFNDLLGDLPTEIGRIADFLEIAVSKEDISEITQAVSFDSIKAHASTMGPIPPEFALGAWKHGYETFFFKGTNGRWKDVLTPEELVMYERAKTRVLTPDCARWLEGGRTALIPSSSHA